MTDKLTQRPETSGVGKNEDTQLWERETQEEPFKSYASIHLTKNAEGLGICLGGHCIVMSIEKWHSMALNGPPAVKWMPIETAPRDGTAVLCARGGNDLYPCMVMRFVGGFWSIPGLVPKVQPTHWMPLPPAPTDHKESKL